MGKYFVPSKGEDSWRELLASPEKQWKEGYSAYELAHCWERSVNLPLSVEEAFKKSGLSVEILYGFPEYKVSLPGGGAHSQTDLYLLAKANNELLTIMVEGKNSESFGSTIENWLGDNPSEGKRRRLDYLLNQLGLIQQNAYNLRYQLMHRTASALLEARKVNAKHAMMLVHSFSDPGKGFEDYSKFVKLFHLSAQKDEIVGPVPIDGIDLYFGWVTE